MIEEEKETKREEKRARERERYRDIWDKLNNKFNNNYNKVNNFLLISQKPLSFMPTVENILNQYTDNPSKFNDNLLALLQHNTIKEDDKINLDVEGIPSNHFVKSLIDFDLPTPNCSTGMLNEHTTTGTDIHLTLVSRRAKLREEFKTNVYSL
jgi:hypothetical protein